MKPRTVSRGVKLICISQRSVRLQHYLIAVVSLTFVFEENILHKSCEVAGLAVIQNYLHAQLMKLTTLRI